MYTYTYIAKKGVGIPYILKHTYISKYMYRYSFYIIISTDRIVSVTVINSLKFYTRRLLKSY